MEFEVWKDIEGYEGLYRVSDRGRVKSMWRVVEYVGRGKRVTIPERILKEGKERTGYRYVKLSKDGKKTQFMINRLVAIAFIPNPDNYPQTNHIDGVKWNNHVDNLEWCNASQNALHASAMGLKKTGSLHPDARAITQHDMDGNLIAQYGAIVEVEAKGFNKTNISSCCRGKRSHAHGYIWKFKESN